MVPAPTVIHRKKSNESTKLEMHRIHCRVVMVGVRTGAELLSCEMIVLRLPATRGRLEMKAIEKLESQEMKEEQSSKAGLTPAQRLLSDLWDEHVRDEFATKDAAAALDTMV